MPSAIGMGIGIPFNYVVGALANSATAWYFGELGLAGTPWNNLSRTGLGTRIGPTGLVEYGPHNLLATSESTNPTDWIARNFVNFSAGPNAGEIVIEYTSASSFCYMLGTTGLVTSQPFYWAAEVKAGTKSGNVVLRDPNGAGLARVTLTSDWQTVFFTGNSAAPQIGFDNRSGFGILGDGNLGTIIVRKLRLMYGLIDTGYVPTTSAARYLPRIDYDPVTLAARGLLVEGQATNLLKTTDNLTSTSWAVAGLSITANATVSPDGTLTADTITGTSGTNAVLFDSSGTSLSAGSASLSLFVKRGTADFCVLSLWGGSSNNGVNVWVNLSTGAVGSNAVTAGYTFTSASVTVLPNGWFRIVLVGTTPTATVFTSLRLVDADGGYSYAGTVGKTCHVWGAQLETGSVATSYIPNPGTGTAVRVADDWFLSGTALTAAWNTSAMTVVIEYYDTGATKDVLTVRNTSPSSWVAIYSGVGSVAAWIYNSVSGLNVDRTRAITNGTPAAPVLQKLALGFSASEMSFVANGGAVSSLAISLALPGAPTEFNLARGLISGASNHVIKSCRVLPGQYITGAALQALTA